MTLMDAAGTPRKNAMGDSTRVGKTPCRKQIMELDSDDALA